MRSLLKDLDAQTQSAILSSFPVALCVTDCDGRIEATTHRFADLLQRKSEQLKGQFLLDLQQNPDREAWQKALRSVLSGPESVKKIDQQFRVTDGSLFWMRITLSPIEGPAQVRILCLFEDIQQEKDQEAAIEAYQRELEEQVLHSSRGLARRLDHLHNLLAASDDFRLLIDGRGRVLGASTVDKQASADPAFSPANLSQALPQAEAEAIQKWIGEAWPVHSPMRRTLQAGDRWLSVWIEPVGSDEMLAITVRDVTRQKHIDDYLEAHRQHLARVVEERTAEFQGVLAALPHALLVMERRQEGLWLLEANPSACSMFALEELISQPADSAGLRSIYDILERTFAQVEREERAIELDFRVIQHDRIEIYHLNCFPLSEQKQAALLTNITESVNRDRRREFLELQDREIHRFGRDLHDLLGGQLTGLLFLLGSLRSQAGMPEQGPAVAIIDQVLDGLQESVRQVRDFARAIVAAPHSLPEFVRTVRQYLAETERNYQVQTHFRVEATLELPESGAFSQWLLLIREAVTNSCKHGQPRQVTVSLNRRGQGHSLEVENDGRPLSLEYQKVGLGLSNMRKRVELLGGQMELLSPAGGVTYRFHFPQ